VLTTKKGVPNENAFFVDENGKVVFTKEGGNKNIIKKLVNFKGYRGSSTGVVVFSKEFLLKYKWKTGNGRLSIYRDIVPELIKQEKLMAYNTGRVFFIDTGTPDRYRAVKRHEGSIFGGLKNKYQRQNK
jgi:NDP-sugar pyrophosphorylase family protein